MKEVLLGMHPSVRSAATNYLDVLIVKPTEHFFDCFLNRGEFRLPLPTEVVCAIVGNL